MAKKMLIDATHAEETRVVVVDGNRVEEFDFESENRRQLAGNIYLAKVTRVEPSLQAAFVDYGGNRHGFLAFSEIHPDYYQIPVADREALLAEEAELARSQAEEAEQEESGGKGSSRRRSRAAASDSGDALATAELAAPDAGAEASESSATAGAAAAETAEDIPESMAVIDTGADKSAGLVQEDGQETAAGEAADAADAADAPPEDREEAEDPEDAGTQASDPAGRDEGIERIADDDTPEEITRRPRKLRPRKYKIQEVIKVRQIMLVQVVKEERGNKGAALTTYLSLAGRYCVLMPNTARGGGISRKITNAADRKKLKQIASEIEVPEGAGLIIRTAGARRTKTEIKRDYEYLQRLWEQIRELTLKSIAPTKIYEEGDLIKRSIRDLYNKEIEEVLVEGEAGYRTAKNFMKMIMPSHAKNVKLYKEALPLFARYQVESYLASMFNPTVQLKSGGYIVIGVTEALVAIDVNSGRSTREGSIEETALKTNLEAAEEIARQLRLRDLAGLIVIDFIDMEERKNNAAVEKRFKERLKHDRARIQVGRISGFGLLEMSRQRLRPGMIEASTQPCPACHGTGLIRSDDSLALSILRQLEEEGTRRRSREVLLRAPVAITNYLVNQKREHIARIEARYGMAVRIEADPFLIAPDFAIEKFKTATRRLSEAETQVVSVDATLVPAAEEAETSPDDGPAPKKRRRRRRRRKSSSGGGEGASASETARAAEESPPAGTRADAAAGETAADAGGAGEGGPRDAADAPAGGAAGTAEEEAAASSPAEDAGRTTRKVARSRRKSASAASGETASPENPPADETPQPAGQNSAAPTGGAESRNGDAPAPEAAPDDAQPEGKKVKSRSKSSGRKSGSSARKSGLKSAARRSAAAGAAEPSQEPSGTGPEPAPESAPQAEPAVASASGAGSAAGKEAGQEAGRESGEASTGSASRSVAAPADTTDRPRKRGWWSLGR